MLMQAYACGSLNAGANERRVALKYACLSVPSVTFVRRVPGTCDADRSSASMSTASGRQPPPPLQPRVPLDSDGGSVVVAKFVDERLNKPMMQLLVHHTHDGQARHQPNVA